MAAKYREIVIGVSAMFATSGALAQVIEEVVVTAQKREQNLQDVSVSVTAFSGSALEALGIDQTVDLARQTPGLNIKNAVGDQNPVISIRGIGLNDFLPNNSPTASVYIDQVVVPSHAMLGFQLFDIERVEVLKGPQGTLYGRNTTAGAINFVSVAPSWAFNGYATADVSSYETTEIEAAVGGPLSDKLAARFSTLYRHRGKGYQYNRFLDEHHGKQERLAGRLQFNYVPTERVDVLVNIHGGTEDSDSPFYEHNGSLVPEGAPFGNIGNFCAPALAGIQVNDGSCVDFQGYYDPDDDPHTGDWNAVFGNINTGDAAGIALTADIDFENFVFTSVTGYDTLSRKLSEDVDNSPFSSIDDLHEDDISAFSQEFRLTSDTAGEFEWMLGAFYSTDDLDRQLTEDVTDLDGFVLSGDIRQDSRSLALFAHTKWHLSQSWSLNAGLRFTDEEKDYSIDRFDDGVPVFSGSDTLKDDDVSGELGVEYRPTEEALVYGKISKGYKSGNFNGSVAVHSLDQIRPTEAEEVYAYELGYKSELFDERLRLNLSGYFYQWDSFQNRGVALVDGRLTSTLITAGDAEIRGLEADALWAPIDNLEIAIAGNFMDTEVVRGALDPVTGEPVNEGNELQNSPELTVNGRTRYSWTMADSFTASMQVDFSWQDQVFFNVNNNPFHAQEPYTIWGARATFGPTDARWELALWGRNLGDEEYRVEVFDIFDLGSSLFIYGEPRTAGLSFTYHFE